MSVPEWLESTEIGAGSRLGKLLLSNTVTENGGDPEEQSALNLIELTAHSPSSHLELLPGDDEKLHVAGGNDQLVSGMLAELPAGTLQHGYQLVALSENSSRTITLSFDTSGGTVDVTADYVVLALPFSTLRNVDLSQSRLSATKQTVIQTLGTGSNAKIHVELQHKTWPQLGFAGAAYGEWDRFCCAWDDSVPLGADASPACCLASPAAMWARASSLARRMGVPRPSISIGSLVKSSLFTRERLPRTLGALTRTTGRWILGCLGPTPITRSGRRLRMGNLRLLPRDGFTSRVSTPPRGIRVSRGSGSQRGTRCAGTSSAAWSSVRPSTRACGQLGLLA